MAITVAYGGMDINDGTVFTLLDGFDPGEAAKTFDEYRSYDGTVAQSNVTEATLVEMHVPLKVAGTTLANLHAAVGALNTLIDAGAQDLVFNDGSGPLTYSCVESPRVAYVPNSSSTNKFWTILDLVLYRLPAYTGTGTGGATWTPTIITDFYPYIVTDFGATGDGVTDDTAAFAAAIAAVDALEGDWPLYEKPAIYVPAGRYCLTNFALTAHKNIRITGEGKNATVLVATDVDGILFDLGVFDGTPTSWYEGASDGFTLENLSVVEPTNDEGKPPGRTATAIRDCGCGRVTLKNVEVRGFQYGFLGAYGSDFSIIHDCKFVYNDTGITFGPHSNQFDIARTEIDGGGVGVLLQWPVGATLRDCYFHDHHAYDIKFDYTSPTDAGVTHADSYYTQAALVDHCWFESGAGFYGSDAHADPTGHIYIGGTTSTPNGIVIRDSMIYAKTLTTDDQMNAEDGDTVYGFVRLAAGTNIIIENTRHYGTRLDAAVAPLDGYTAGTVTVRDWVNHALATTPPAICSPWIAGCVYQSGSGRTITTTDAQLYRKLSSSDGDSFFRMRWEPSTNKVVFGVSTDDSTWVEYFALNPSGKLFFGYQPSACVLSFGAAAPSTGAHLLGEIVLNSSPAAEGKIGWVCTVAGTPGTWKTFGAIDA